MTPPKTTPTRLKKARRLLSAFKYRSAGFSFHEVADAMIREFGNDLPKAYFGDRPDRAAWDDVNDQLTYYLSELTVNVEGERQMELVKLDEMQKGVWLKAKQGDHKAIASVLKIMERRERLIPGLAVPVKVAPTDPTGAAPYEPQGDDATTQRILELLQRAEERRAAGDVSD